MFSLAPDIKTPLSHRLGIQAHEKEQVIVLEIKKEDIGRVMAEYESASFMWNKGDLYAIVRKQKQALQADSTLSPAQPRASMAA